MDWQATDQFGNLNIGDSDAQSFEELSNHISMLVAEVRERAGDTFEITVDFNDGEISGPHPENVSHIMRAPWIASQERETVLAEVTSVVEQQCGEKGFGPVTVSAVTGP